MAERLRQQFSSVFNSRAKPLFDQDLPALLVYTSGEDVRQERWSMDGYGPLTRQLDVYIEAVDTGKDELDDKLDEMARKIESLMDGWQLPDFSNAVIDFKATDMDINSDGKKTYGAIRLFYQITYFTQTKSYDD